MAFQGAIYQQREEREIMPKSAEAWRGKAVNGIADSKKTGPDVSGAVEALLRQVMVTGDPEVDEVLRTVPVGGKRLRPALLAAWAGFGKPGRVVIRLAAGVELLHLATLVHDDIVDGAGIRRGAPSVNRRWGAEAAVLVGDYLFACAYDLLTYGGAGACRIADALIRDMTIGEIRQLRSLFNVGRDEKDYFDCIELKTARFLGGICQLGARASGLTSVLAMRAHEFGLALGMAFQIADDLQDFGADNDSKDLASGLLTLPVIHLLRQPAGAGYAAWIARGRLGRDEVVQICQAAVDVGGLEYGRQMAGRFIGRAAGALEGLNGEPRRRLDAIIHEVSARLAPFDNDGGMPSAGYGYRAGTPASPG